MYVLSCTIFMQGLVVVDLVPFQFSVARFVASYARNLLLLAAFVPAIVQTVVPSVQRFEYTSPAGTEREVTTDRSEALRIASPSPVVALLVPALFVMQYSLPLSSSTTTHCVV